MSEATRTAGPTAAVTRSDDAGLAGGFSNPPIEAAHAFRAVMDAMARPGRIYDIAGALPPPPLSSAAGAVLLTLCDVETPIYLAGTHNTEAVRSWIAFQTGSPLTDPANAAFALGSWPDLMPLQPYAIGTPQYPDRSATLIVELDALVSTGAVLKGPGIKTESSLSLPDCAAFQANHALYPLGLDFIFTSGNKVAALPRSTNVQSTTTSHAEANGCM